MMRVVLSDLLGSDTDAKCLVNDEQIRSWDRLVFLGHEVFVENQLGSNCSLELHNGICEIPQPMWNRWLRRSPAALPSGGNSKSPRRWAKGSENVLVLDDVPMGHSGPNTSSPGSVTHISVQSKGRGCVSCISI